VRPQGLLNKARRSRQKIERLGASFMVLPCGLERAFTKNPTGLSSQFATSPESPIQVPETRLHFHEGTHVVAACHRCDGRSVLVGTRIRSVPCFYRYAIRRLKNPTRTHIGARDYICMKEQKETISLLNDLIETLKDGQEGFKRAAEAVKDRQLKSLFSEYSQQRSLFASALQNEVRSLGQTKPEASSTAAGALHRGWINLKSALSGGDDHAILAECERGEDSAVEEYKKALDDDLSPSLYELVSRQYSDIKAAHDRIRNLRDARS
jgi:uncharacterized protein (TIGR02284 family)